MTPLKPIEQGKVLKYHILQEYWWLDFMEILGNLKKFRWKFGQKILMEWKLIKTHKNVGKNSKK